MTSTPSPHDEHPEIDEISALDEGIVPVARRAELRAHLLTCELCAEVSASLEEIQETLGTLPRPERMPEDVASRIDRALAAEATLAASAPGKAESTTGTDATADRTTDRVPTVDGSGAAIHARTDSDSAGHADSDSDSGDATAQERPVSRETATEPLGSAAGTDACPVSRETQPGRRSGDAAAGRPPGRAAGSTGPGGANRGAPAPGPGRRSDARGARHRRRTVVLVAAASMAVLTLGGITLRALSDPAPTEVTSNTAKSATDEGAPRVSSSPTVSADTDAGGSSDDQRLRKRVQGLLSDESSPPPSREVTDSPTPSDTPTVDVEQSPSSDRNTLRDDTLGDGPTMPSCIRDSLHRTESPLAVDSEATFQNHSGYLVVLPHQGGDPKLVDAYVVDPSCVSADPSRPGKILFKGTYPRG
ncbi:hypothetical protein [Streptomyces qinglanensis]|uniref:hypothetical protein n=1 Tax=Streptomyces qinglanensis TaxID=943816 RepID=UPI0037A6E185